MNTMTKEEYIDMHERRMEEHIKQCATCIKINNETWFDLSKVSEEVCDECVILFMRGLLKYFGDDHFLISFMRRKQ